MTAWTTTAGIATVWLLVLVLGTGAGYAAVLAWGRWGGRVPLPVPVARAAAFALGAPGVHAPRVPALPEPVASAAPPTVAVPVPVPAAALEPAEPGPTMEPVEATAGEPSNGDEMPAPARTRSRADALSELTALLRLEYDAAAALVAHGLWGFDNYDEWTRSMRGQPRPDDVPADAWERVLQGSWRDLEPQVAAHREKQQAVGTLESLWGVGPDEAEALYKAGYRDVAAIRKASTDTIAKVPGIGAAKAFQIRAAAHGLAPTV